MACWGLRPTVGMPHVLNKNVPVTSSMAFQDRVTQGQTCDVPLQKKRSPIKLISRVTLQLREANHVLSREEIPVETEVSFPRWLDLHRMYPRVNSLVYETVEQQLACNSMIYLWQVFQHHTRYKKKIQDTISFILEWTTSLDTSSRTLFVREGGCPSGCPRHVERRVT